MKNLDYMVIYTCQFMWESNSLSLWHQKNGLDYEFMIVLNTSNNFMITLPRQLENNLRVQASTFEDS